MSATIINLAERAPTRPLLTLAIAMRQDGRPLIEIHIPSQRLEDEESAAGRVEAIADILHRSFTEIEVSIRKHAAALAEGDETP